MPQIGTKPFTRLDMIGRGGTSRVYKVVSPKNDILALKRVQIDPSDHETMKGYMNEIALLKRLDGNDRIIRLIDSDTKTSGPNKGLLFLLMELGEIGTWHVVLRGKSVAHLDTNVLQTWPSFCRNSRRDPSTLRG